MKVGELVKVKNSRHYAAWEAVAIVAIIPNPNPNTTGVLYRVQGGGLFSEAELEAA